jgi:hypothetical protein
MAYSEIVWIAGSLLMGISILSIICSAITLYILHQINNWNGYIKLVYLLAVWQIFYDLSFFFLIPYQYHDFYCAYRGWNSGSGIAVVIVINLMSALVLHTVIYLKAFRIKVYFRWIWLIILIIAFTFGILDFYSCVQYPNSNVTNWIYFSLRAGSITFNAIVFISITILLNLPYSVKCLSWTLSDFALRRKTNDLLIILVGRLKYYPIVQIFTRIFAIWWDLEYGFQQTAWTGHYSTEKLIVQLAYDITNPFAGIGYFFVFLCVQPTAYAYFSYLLTSWWCCCSSSFQDLKSSSLNHSTLSKSNSNQFQEDMSFRHVTSSVDPSMPSVDRGSNITAITNQTAGYINFDPDLRSSTRISLRQSLLTPHQQQRASNQSIQSNPNNNQHYPPINSAPTTPTNTTTNNSHFPKTTSIPSAPLVATSSSLPFLQRFNSWISAYQGSVDRNDTIMFNTPSATSMYDDFNEDSLWVEMDRRQNDPHWSIDL